MTSWTVRVDRRKDRADEVLGELLAIGEVVEGLTVTEVHPGEVGDAGKFRDFVDLATMTHESEAVLETVGEELLLEFGWLIDFQK